MADHALGGVHLQAVAGSEHLLEGGTFGNVAKRGRCAVGIHVAHLVRGNTSIAESHLDSETHAFAIFTRGGHVVSIGAHADTGNAGEDVRATLLCVREAFEHEDAGALAHHETVAVLVERAGGGGGVIVALAQGMHVGKAGEGERADRFVGTAGQHDVGTAKADGVKGGCDRMVGGCASRNHGEAGAHPAGAVGNFAGGHVGNRHRDEERRNTVRTTGAPSHRIFGVCVHTADTGTDNHARAGRILGLRVNASILQGLESGIDCILDALREPGLVACAEKFGAVKFLDSGRNLDRQCRDIEPVDGRNAGLALQKVVPKDVGGIAKGRHAAHTGNYYFFHSVFLYNKLTSANIANNFLTLKCFISHRSRTPTKYAKRRTNIKYGTQTAKTKYRFFCKKLNLQAL